MMADGQPLKKPPGYMDPTMPPPPPPAGPRKPVVPPTFYKPQKQKRNCCRTCCCCVCFSILFLIIVLGILIAVFFAWVQPKIPIFHFSQLELDKFSVGIKSDGTALLTSKAVIKVEVTNPNTKMIIYYGDTDITLNLDKEITLGTATVPGFEQPPNNVTLLKFSLGVDNELIESSLGLELNKRVKNEDTEVNAAVKTKFGIGVGMVKIGMLPVNVNCGGITMKELDDGNVSPKCSFNTLRWITIH